MKNSCDGDGHHLDTHRISFDGIKVVSRYILSSLFPFPLLWYLIIPMPTPYQGPVQSPYDTATPLCVYVLPGLFSEKYQKDSLVSFGYSGTSLPFSSKFHSNRFDPYFEQETICRVSGSSPIGSLFLYVDTPGSESRKEVLICLSGSLFFLYLSRNGMDK